MQLGKNLAGKCFQGEKLDNWKTGLRTCGI